MNDLKQEFDVELSRLLREYEDLGLSPEQMSDSLDWHSELVEIREPVPESDIDEKVLAD